MSVATSAGIVFGEGEEVLVELEASLSDSGKGLNLMKNALSVNATIVVTNRRIMAISGATTKKKCCGGAKKRSVRYFVPSQITEVGYKMESTKSCCCGKSNFSIYLKTSGCNSVDISLRNMNEKSVQDVIKVIYEVINGSSITK